jgi:hypothetical protein
MAKIGQKEIKSSYPFTEGLTLGTDKLPETIGETIELSAISKKEKELIN